MELLSLECGTYQLYLRRQVVIKVSCAAMLKLQTGHQAQPPDEWPSGQARVRQRSITISDLRGRIRKLLRFLHTQQHSHHLGPQLPPESPSPFHGGGNGGSERASRLQEAEPGHRPKRLDLRHFFHKYVLSQAGSGPSSKIRAGNKQISKTSCLTLTVSWLGGKGTRMEKPFTVEYYSASKRKDTF